MLRKAGMVRGSGTTAEVSALIDNQQISRVFQGFVENGISYALNLKTPTDGKIKAISFKSSGTTNGTFSIFDDGIAIAGLENISTSTNAIAGLDIDFAKGSNMTIVFTGTLELVFDAFIDYSIIIL